MRTLLGLFIVAIAFNVNAQKYVSEAATISFFSEAPLENIEAKATQKEGSTYAAINIETGSFFFKIPINNFAFENGLMEEHFNENYMESEKHPFGVLKGKITGDVSYEKDGEYEAVAKGTMNIHGVDKEMEVKGKVIAKDGKFTIVAEFPVRLEDHKIDIPKNVVSNIAEEVLVKVNTSFKKL